MLNVNPEILQQTDKLIDKMLRDTKVSGKDKEQVFCATLFLRIRNGYESVKVLFDKEMYFEASYIIRNLIETMLVLRYLAENSEDAIERLIANHKFQNEMLKHHCRTTKEYEFLREKLDIQLGKKTKGPNSNKKTSIFKWSKLAKLSNFYVLMYSWYCEYSHTSITGLQTLLDVKDDEILGFKESLGTKDIDSLYHAIQFVVILSMEVVNQVFKCEVNAEIDKIQKLLENQHKKI